MIADTVFLDSLSLFMPETNEEALIAEFNLQMQQNSD